MAGPGKGPVRDPFRAQIRDSEALLRALRRATEKLWLTLEVLLGQELIEPKLGRPGHEWLQRLCESPSLTPLLLAVPAPLRLQAWRDIHASRKTGPLLRGEVDIETLMRQLSRFHGREDLRSLSELEWYALGDLQRDLQREGFASLGWLFDVRTDQGDSVLVRLACSFVPHELELEGEKQPDDNGPEVLAPELGRWLSQHAEPLDVLLDELYAKSERPVRCEPAEAAARIRQGLSLAQRGEYERAIIEFTFALQANPASAPLRVHRGDAYRLQGDYERATADYTAALQLDPANILAYVNRGTVYRLKGEYDRAARDYTEALRLDPKSVVAYIGHGIASAQQGEYSAAIADYTEALRLDPVNTWAYQGRGDAHAGTLAYEQAVADYTEALRLNPYFPLALCNRGDSYRLKGQYGRAVADYGEALRLEPANPRIFVSRGTAYRDQELFAQALADFSEAIRLDPTNPSIYLHRGITFQQLEDYDRAVADFTHAEQFDADNPEIFLRRALAYRSQASYERAVADLTRAIELNPSDAVTYRNRGCVLALKRKFGEALADFTEAIRLDPDAQAYLERARVYFEQKEYARAADDSAMALHLDVGLVSARLVRGSALLRIGRQEEAVVEFTNAIQANSRCAVAYNNRGVAYSMIGRLAEAIEDFTQAIVLDKQDAQAYANRARAYHQLKQHENALQDYTQALLLDPKYGAGYCLVRGLVQIDHCRLDAAVADLTIALLLDPNNAAARAAREEALRAERDREFELGPLEEPALVLAEGPTVLPAEAEPGREVNDSDQPKVIARARTAPVVKTSARVPAKPVQTLERGTVGSAPDATPNAANSGTDSALSSHTNIESSKAVCEAAIVPSEALHSANIEGYQREQTLLNEKEQSEQLRKMAELRAKQEQEKQRQRAQAGTRQAKSARRAANDDDRSPLERWRKPLIAAAAIFVLAASSYYARGWLQTHRKIDPPLKADALWQEFKNDPEAANQKYANRRFFIVGKLVIEQRGRNGPRQVYFLPPLEGHFRIHCNFTAPNELAEVPSGRSTVAYLISGEFQPYAHGPHVELSRCEFIGASRQEVARSLDRDVDAPARAMLRLCSTGFCLHISFCQRSTCNVSG